MLVMLACGLFTDDLQQALPAAAAIEMFHNFTLLHDDIMDNAAVRRGKPSVFARWGQNVAILSGDAMLICAYRLLGGVSAHLLPQVMTLFNEMALGVCEGQQYDMDFEHRRKVSVVDYMHMIELKTSVLLAGAATIGATIGGASDEDCRHRGGVDSVYFGVGRLNMRSHSANHFDIGDLRQIVAICTEHEIKTYLTVNTIIYDNDLATMREILDAAREAGVSAIIASDVAVMSYCRQIGLEVHLSTQLNISNVEALRFYAQFADVAVLARELNMDQVSHIYEAIHGPEPILGPAGQPVRIEMFCHGLRRARRGPLPPLARSLLRLDGRTDGTRRVGRILPP